MKLDPRKIDGDLPRDQELDWLPTEPPIDDRPFADSAFDLARGLDVVELPVAPVPPASNVRSTPHAWQSWGAEEQKARVLGVEARRASAPPNVSPFEPGTALDLWWMDGYSKGL